MKLETSHEKKLDPGNTHEKKFQSHEKPTKAQWHDGTRPTRPTMTRNPLNLVYSLKTNKNSLKYLNITGFRMVT